MPTKRRSLLKKNPLTTAGHFIQDVAAGIDGLAGDVDKALNSLNLDQVEPPAEEEQEAPGPEAEEAMASVTNQATLAWQLDHLLDDVLHLEVDHLPQQGKINGEACDCLLPGTLVYTLEMAATINKIEARRDVLTHEGRHQRVSVTMVRHYSGQLVSLTPYYTSLPLSLTPNHPAFAVKDGVLPAFEDDRFISRQGLEKNLTWVPSGDLNGRDLMSFPRLTHTQDMETVNCDLAELFGWYVAEGCRDKVGNRIVLALGKHETTAIRRIQEIIKRQFGVDPCTYDRPTCVHIAFSHQDFSPILAAFGDGARNKTIPIWLLHLPWNKQYAFLRGLISGDGSIDSHSINIATTSQNLAVQLRLLLFRLGLLHGLSRRLQPDSNIGGRLIKATGPLYEIRIAGAAAVELAKNIQTPYRPPLQKPCNYGCVEEGYVLFPIRRWGLEEYNGPVHNMEVETDNSYVTLQGSLHNCIAKGARETRRHAMETIPIAARQGVDATFFTDIAKWANHLIDIGTLDAVKSGQYDKEYLEQSGKASNIRKALESMLAELKKGHRKHCETCPSVLDMKGFIERRRKEGKA